MVESRAQLERNGDGIAYRAPKDTSAGTLRERITARVERENAEPASKAAKHKKFTLTGMWADLGYTPYRTEPSYYTIGWKQDGFIAQSDPDLCWAAAFAMASHHLGIAHSESDFAQANRKACGSAAKSATLNQIVHAAGTVYTGQGVWISDPEGTQEAWAAQQTQQTGSTVLSKLLGLGGGLPLLTPPPLITPWQGQAWYRTLPNGEQQWGGLYLVTKPSMLLRAVINHHPVVIGYKEGGGMHTVLLIGLWARPGGPEIAGQGIEIEMGATKIESVDVVDPRGSGAPYTITGDELIRWTLFAIEVRP